MRPYLVAGLLSAAALCAPAWAASPALEVYGRLPAMDSVRLSPTGDQYAYLASEGGERKVIVRGLEGRPVAMVPVGDSKVRGLRWAGESHLLISVSKTYDRTLDFGVSEEVFNVVSLNVATGKQAWVLAQGARSNGVWGEYGVYEKDGRWWGVYAGLASTRVRGAEYLDFSGADLFRVDLDSGAGSRLADGTEIPGGGRDWLIDADGALLVQLDYNHNTGDWRITAAKGGKVLASGVDLLGDTALVALGRTPGRFVYQRRDADNVVRWREASMTGGEETILDQDSVDRVLIDPRDGALRGYDPSADQVRTVAFDPALDAKLKSAARAFPGASVRLVSWSRDLSRLLVHTSGGTDSGTWWLFDLKANKARELGWSYPDIAPEQVAPSRMVSWKAADGLQISGVLTLPLGREAKGLPVVVLPHGGPASRDTLDFDWLAQAFASRGYAVLQPNFRGSSGYTTAFETTGHGEWGGKMQTDVSDGLAWLARSGVVDPGRACVVGASYGGYVALAGVTLQQGLYRCAVSYAGVGDLQALWKQFARRSGGGGSAAGRYFLASIKAGTDLKARSPITFADKADAPVLLMHGQDDTVVVFEQSAAMDRALKKAGKASTLVSLPGEDHWLSRAASRTAMLQAAVAFVETNNPPR